MPLAAAVAMLGLCSLALCSAGPPRAPCKHFNVGQKVRVTAYPDEEYLVIGIGFACSVELWKPDGTHGSLPAETLEKIP